MAEAYQQVMERVRAEGLHPAVLSTQIDAFLAKEPLTHSLVLTDMQVDATTGVRMLLTIGLLTRTRVLFLDVLEDTDPLGVPVLRTSMRVLPLRSIIEVRTMTHVTVPADASPAPMRFQVEFVTSEVGDIVLGEDSCPGVIVDGEHLDPEELADLNPDEIEDVALCGDTMGMSGVISSNGVLLVEEAALSGPSPVAELMGFAAAVSMALSGV